MPELYRLPDVRQLASIWRLRMADRHWPTAIRPGDSAPIITRHGVRMARLGLPSRWAMNERGAASSVPIVEAASRSYTREPFAKQRWCAIPALAVFLPSYADPARPPQWWTVAAEDDSGFVIAGLYDRYRSAEDGREVLTFGMLSRDVGGHPVLSRFGRTRAAGGFQAPILLERARAEAWIAASSDGALALAADALGPALKAAPPVPLRLPRDDLGASEGRVSGAIRLSEESLA